MLPVIGPRFVRSEPRKNAVAYMQGLLSDRERKNSWTMSEQVGQAVPDPMRWLLSTTDRGPDAVRDDLCSYVVDHLGDQDGVLIVDETGFVRKGDRSVGVARQYTGTAGRIEIAQVGEFLTYATSEGRTFLDRELYLPKSWTGDLQRCRGAGTSNERGFRTKPELAMQMIAGVIDGGVPASRVTGDAVYGGHYRLRKRLEDRQMNYVLAVASSQHVIAKTSASVIGIEYRADALIAALPAAAWRTRAAGQGTKGDRRRVGACPYQRAP